jgi:hypothetical protein
MSEDQEKPGFRVTDRRRFAGEGAATEAAPEPRPSGATAAPPIEPVTFSTFVLGLSTQAVVTLGEAPNPVTGVVEQDLLSAKQLIDILGILRDKTRNNLEQAEERLLESILYDLRMRYVELVRSSKKEEA